MKKTSMPVAFALALAALTALSVRPAHAQNKPQDADIQIAAPAGMKLVWHDEFDRDGAPDPSKWNFESGFARNEEAQWYQRQNATVKDGKLIIEARREIHPNPNYKADSDDWKLNREIAQYTSASLSTQGRAAWTYGHFEMRARIDTRQGMWPAFWTVGQNGEWPSNGEIDIMEYYRGKLLANFAWGTDKRWNAKWNSSAKPIADFADPKWANQFHVWAMDWDKDKITLSVDGEITNTQKLSETVNGDAEGRNPFHAPQFILLNLAIGGQNGGDPDKTEFPAHYEIDYVRVFQPVEIQ